MASPTYIWARSASELPEVANLWTPALSRPNPSVWMKKPTVKKTAIESTSTISARGIVRRGSRLSSPNVAVPSKPAKEMNPPTAARKTVDQVTPEIESGRVNGSRENDCPDGAV